MMGYRIGRAPGQDLAPAASSGDFLNIAADTPLHESFLAAGVACELLTNFMPILEAARESLVPLDSPQPSVFTLRFWVDPTASAVPPWPKPYFRGLDHLAFGGFASENSVLIDRRARRAIGRFSRALGADRPYWKSVIFSSLLTALCGSIGVTELHCGCVARGRSGLLLAGCSGSGKSTLALALALSGWAFLSDDRTWISWRDGRLSAWGLPTLLKLRPDSAASFPELRDFEPAVDLDGQKTLKVDPERQLGLRRTLRCEPRWLVFLERHESPTNSLTRVPRDEAAARLRQDLLPESTEDAERQRETIDRLVERGCWLLRYGGTPQDTSRELVHLVDSEFGASVPRLPNKLSAHPETAPQDPLRFLTPTPYAADLRVMGRKIRLETNSLIVVNETQRLFERYASFDKDAGRYCELADAHVPEFRWRIVIESHPVARPPWPRITAFSDDHMRYTSIGQRGFAAVDLEKREAVGFLGQGLASDRSAFCTLFLDPLCCMTAGALGLTPVFSTCVALDGSGLLVFGPPNSGKTTSSYLAGELGVEFHADQATFLELEGGILRAWAGFQPLMFRPEVLQFLPELRDVTRPLKYLDWAFLALDRIAIGDRSASVVPVGCVFLNRSAAPAPRLVPLDRSELARRLENNFLFREDPRFDAQRRAVLSGLTKLPAYELAYGDDPAEAAFFFPSLLGRQSRVEVRP